MDLPLPAVRPSSSRRLRLALVAALGACGGGWVGGCADDGGPGALAVTPDPIGFGDVPWMTAPTKTVRLTNRGRRELILRDPKFDCSCFYLTKPLPALHLAPGRSVEVEIGFATTKGEPGPFKKTLTVICDDPAVPKVDVAVTGSIVDFRLVAPRDVMLGDGPAAGPAVERRIEVRGGHGSAVKAVATRSSDPALVLTTRDVPEGSDVLVTTAPGRPAGRVAAQVDVTVEVTRGDGSRHRYVEAVTVRGTVK